MRDIAADAAAAFVNGTCEFVAGVVALDASERRLAPRPSPPIVHLYWGRVDPLLSKFS